MIAAQPYVPISRRTLDLEDYINVARRHSGWIIGPVYAGLVISIVIAYSLQNVYQARATMEIRPSQVSENLVQSTLNQKLNERILQMYNNVTSRASLAQLIQSPNLNLYPDERVKLPMEDVEDEMRKDIQIGTSLDSSPSKSGASNFVISFSYRKRNVARDTVAALVNKFIDESKSSETQQQNTLKDFFGNQVSVAKADLERANDALTSFRQKNEGRLPEQESMNMAALGSLQSQVAGIDQELNNLQNNRLNLETQLTYLRHQLDMTDMLTEDSPSISSPFYRQSEELASLNKQIDGIELQLQQLRQVYKENYVDIRNYKNSLNVLKQKRDNVAAALQKEREADAAKPPTEQKKTTNVKMAMSRAGIEGEIAKFNTQLTINQNDQAARRKDRDRLNKEIENFRERLKATSVLEAQYSDLKRDAASATDKYQKFQNQTDLTKVNAELVSVGASEYLQVLDPPTVPAKPTKPNRPGIVGAGLAISVLLGLALAGVQEAKDSSLKNLKDVRAYTNLPVLCSIPLLENTMLVKKKKRITYLAWSAAVILGILAISGSLIYYKWVISNA